MRNANCNACPLHEECNTVCLWGHGDTKAKIMLVGEAPGRTEDRTGLPFSGKAGSLLNHVLGKLGLPRERLYITNTLKCRPEGNELPAWGTTKTYIAACLPYLWTEIKLIQPKVIVLLGATASRGVANLWPITKYEGLVKRIERWDFLVCVHPAAVLRRPSWEPNLAFALARAAQIAGEKIHPKGAEYGRFDYEHI